MNIEIRDLRKADFDSCIYFAIKGMHFNTYLDSEFELNMYGKYFFYMEMLRSSQIIAAYADGKFVGLLLADVKGEKKAYKSFWKSLYVKTFDFIQNIFFKDSAGGYDAANKEMLDNYAGKDKLDGEICFLAADPDNKIKGVGTALLEEFEKREKGKNIFLYTDDRCTYQFYEHRGFKRVGEKDIDIEIKRKKVKLKCLLYSKRIK